MSFSGGGHEFGPRGAEIENDLEIKIFPVETIKAVIDKYCYEKSDLTSHRFGIVVW